MYHGGLERAHHDKSQATRWTAVHPGVRIRVIDVLDLLAAGRSQEEVLEARPVRPLGLRNAQDDSSGSAARPRFFVDGRIRTVSDWY